MAKEASVAPRERVNITYKPATGDAKEEVELPFKMVVIGDFTLRADDRPLEERKPIRVDKDNFNDVLKKQDLSLDINVEDRLSGNEDAELGITLKLTSLKDFAPESVAEQVPELNKLLELRKALQALKGPLGNLPAFRKKLQSLLKTEEDVDRVLKELGSESTGTDEAGA
jgi:type VI secretion system protein ImpB